MESPLISLIIPIYNVERYLSECLESVTAQTYQNLEVLLINDGSTDASGEIARAFMKKDSRLVLLDKENGGLSDARNFGLDHCQGEYIIFIDSDDVVSPYYVENLVQALQSASVKLAMCKMTRKRSALNNQRVSEFTRVGGSFENRARLLGINQDEQPNDAAWDKIYHQSLVAEIRYPKGRVFEDSSVIFPLLDLAGDYVIVNSLDYYYRPNGTSITGQKIAQKNFDLFIKNKAQIGFLTEKHPDALKFGLSNVLNANDYWAQVAVKDPSDLAHDFFNQLWQQNKIYSKTLGLRKYLYVSRGGYWMLVKFASWAYSSQFFKTLVKKLLMRK